MMKKKVCVGFRDVLWRQDRAFQFSQRRCKRRDFLVEYKKIHIHKEISYGLYNIEREETIDSEFK
jgi:hypothetical protein